MSPAVSVAGVVGEEAEEGAAAAPGVQWRTRSLPCTTSTLRAPSASTCDCGRVRHLQHRGRGGAAAPAPGRTSAGRSGGGEEQRGPLCSRTG